jgi:hypothetical protein
LYGSEVFEGLLHRSKGVCACALRQYLHFCTSKASKLSTFGLGVRVLVRMQREHHPPVLGVSICTFLPVKQVN